MEFVWLTVAAAVLAGGLRWLIDIRTYKDQAERLYAASICLGCFAATSFVVGAVVT